MVTERAATDASRVRQRNLAAVLQLVHRRRTVTRADLTRALGLNRSTIGDLVAALAEAGWVDEVDDAPRAKVGRPSPRVVPRSDRLVVAVNPELDAIDVALVALGGTIVARQRVIVDGAPSIAETVEVTAAAVERLAAEHPSSRIVGAGVAVPGLVRRSDGFVRLAAHLDWREQPVAAPLAAALGVPASAANDAHLGCRAELAFGAGQGARTLLYLNGGPSGIGGGIAINGALTQGSEGYAGELGHLGVDPRGPLCACGARGCLDAVVTRAELAAAVSLVHPDDDELEAAVRAAATRDGGATDAALEAVVARHLDALGMALRGAVNLLNPDRIVLGGHLAALWAAAHDDQRANLLADALRASAEGVRIEPAALGSQRLLVGAAELAWEGPVAHPLSEENHTLTA